MVVGAFELNYSILVHEQLSLSVLPRKTGKPECRPTPSLPSGKSEHELVVEQGRNVQTFELWALVGRPVCLRAKTQDS